MMDDYEDFYYEETKEEKFYKFFPIIDEILIENRREDFVPTDYLDQKTFQKGINMIKSINKKNGCHLSFNHIVNYLNFIFEKDSKKSTPINMSREISNYAMQLALDMEKNNSYWDATPEKQAEKIKQNYKEISKVLGLYVKLNPDKFPQEERKEDLVFDSNGRLRTTFNIDPVIDLNAQAETLCSISKDVSKRYFGEVSGVGATEDNILDMVRNIIEETDESAYTDTDPITKLAKCVRLLRPLQVKKDNRSIWEYFTNHKIYVSERKMLKECKEEMKRLGLDKKEISKVLHGKAFNDIKFNDGLTIREKLYPTIQINPESDELNNSEIVEGNEVEKDKELYKQSIVVEDAVDQVNYADNQIEDKEISKTKETNIQERNQANKINVDLEDEVPNYVEEVKGELNKEKNLVA